MEYLMSRDSKENVFPEGVRPAPINNRSSVILDTQKNLKGVKK